MTNLKKPLTAAMASFMALVILATTVAVPTGEASAQAASTMRLVTISDNDSGWLLDGETSQWLSPECRKDLETNGRNFAVVEWEVLADTGYPQAERSCDQVLTATATPAATPPASATSPVVVATSSANGSLDLASLGLERGINLAGDFEVEPRGSWGRRITSADIQAVAAAGFDHIRLPIRWSAHTGPAPRYRIDPAFRREVSAVVNEATSLGLTVIINVHHFEELNENPRAERRHFLAIWRQVSRFYRDTPDSVIFELLNEPTGTFDDNPALWNRFARQALRLVRRQNPDRPVMIGPVGYNHANRLPNLRLPNDPNLIATVHTYDPIPFTIQGAVWTNPVLPTGLTWEPGTYSLSFDSLDYSWGAEIDESRTGLSIDFAQQTAGFAVAPAAGARTADRLIVSANRRFDALVLCNFVGGNPTEVPIRLNASGDGEADLSGCGRIESLALQTQEAGGGLVTLDRFAMCSIRCHELVLTQEDALDQLHRDASLWARRQNVPLYLGEFGTLDPIGSPTDPASRERWTRVVRDSAEKYGIGWGVFAFEGEMGLFDHDTQEWDSALLGALFD